MIHIFKYLDKKQKYPNHYWSTAKWGLALGQPLVVAKSIIDRSKITLPILLFGNLPSLVFLFISLLYSLYVIL